MTAKSPAITAVPATGDARRRGWRNRWAERENERRRRAYEADAERWRRRADELTRLRVETTCFQGCTQPRVGLPVDLLDDEVLYRVLPAAELVEAEARHVPGLPAPGITVTPLAADKPGSSLPHGLRVADAGMAVVTDRRVAFAGRRGLREWWYEDLIGPAHHPQSPVTLLHTSDGGRLAGLVVPLHAVLNFRFYLTLAYADVLGNRSAVATYLDDLVTAHERARPAAPDPVQAEQAPAVARVRDRPIAAAAATVVTLAAAAAVGVIGPGVPSPVTALGAPVTGGDESTGGSAVATTATTGAPAPTGPDGVPAPPQSGVPVVGGSTGATGGPAPLPTAGTGGPGAPTSEPGRPGWVPSTGGPPTAAPTSASPTPVDLCGAPPNPYGYNYCSGARIRWPADDVCNYFACVENFWSGNGHLTLCGDGLVGLVARESPACDPHGGVAQPVYKPITVS